MLRNSNAHQRRRKLTINFIRHGKTAGNLEQRYIGRTDEPLCDAGIAELGSIVCPACDIVVSSPMLRCLTTAALLYPHADVSVYEELRECDFGDFEGKNHIELNGNAAYQKWLDGGGLSAFPNGEDSTVFRARSVNGFLKAVSDHKTVSTISFIVHGGTIMSILERFAVPHREFYDYMIGNAHGFITEYDGEKIEITGNI